MTNNRRYVIVKDTDDLIQCYGVYADFYKAVGKLICYLADEEEDRLTEGYTGAGRADFEELNMETGFVWTRSYKRGAGQTEATRCSRWYLLTDGEEEGDGT